MSFSGNVKEELLRQEDPTRHCRIAELAAIIAFHGEIVRLSTKKIILRLSAENESIIRKCFTLLEKTFKINGEVSIDKRIVKKNNRFTIDVEDPEETVKILQAVKLLTADRRPIHSDTLVSQMVIQKNCCRRAFLRGAFLCAGSISDPEKFYHFEIVCTTPAKALQLQEIIQSFEIDAKIVKRKKYHVVYVKEGAQIVELLGLMGAGVSLMNLENVRILKGMRNTVNRKVNCETANINKTVNAAVKQMEDIIYIRDTVGLHRLPENLEETALLRLEYPQASLKELGTLLSIPVGKSGINHRLRKICSIAEELRGVKEEQV
ncbi:DNA-binding protein WhiA [Blautia hansenii]|uniref:Probable cell division protein WhiA n=1 Tax=Blautia hansenii TaxID=1322 RepID=A0ABX2I5T3_BLAHA|nr:DNA-binding protein WhiA [Blautia hansenii]MCB5599924.1 DNA-binding protein WhiA [Blautia hansenii]NSJ85345.1 DNA-binding protein WhiA [Blautia hansenii]